MLVLVLVLALELVLEIVLVLALALALVLVLVLGARGSTNRAGRLTARADPNTMRHGGGPT